MLSGGNGADQSDRFDERPTRDRISRYCPLHERSRSNRDRGGYPHTNAQNGNGLVRGHRSCTRMGRSRERKKGKHNLA